MNLKVHLWRLSRYLLFWLSALAWCGCSTVSAPKVTGSILPDEDRSLIISRVKGCSGAVLSYRALSRAAITTGRHTDKVRQIFVFEKPDKLRIETLPTNAAYSLSLFATRNGVFRFLNTTEKTAVTGRLEKSIFKSVLGLPVGADTLMSLLTVCFS